MKKILMGILSILFLAGCSGHSQNKTAQVLIAKMTNCSTYSDLEKNKEGLPILVEQYFSPEGYERFVSSRVGFIYPQFFQRIKGEKTEKIRIKKVKQFKERDSVKFNYKVNYVVISNGEKVKMTDYITVEVDKSNLINEVLILNTSDIIHKMYLDIKIY
ncbi:MAG: hypothetical protein K0R69_747 [Clostridia bacterium]|jgi:PBP1b-binding outer membrane lipoprotein LpoB|nr:hypothetical protein [Clostridia bacterium]